MPGVLKVKVVVDQLGASISQRIPVSIIPSHWSNIRLLNLQTAFEIDFIALYKSGLWVF